MAPPSMVPSESPASISLRPAILEIGAHFVALVGGAKHGDMETTPRHREVRVRN